MISFNLRASGDSMLKVFWAWVVLAVPVVMIWDFWPFFITKVISLWRSKVTRVWRSCSIFHIGRIGTMTWPRTLMLLTGISGTWDSRTTFIPGGSFWTQGQPWIQQQQSGHK